MTREKWGPPPPEFVAALDALIAADEAFEDAERRLRLARLELKRIDERFSALDGRDLIGAGARGRLVERSADPRENYFHVARRRPSPVEGPAS